MSEVIEIKCPGCGARLQIDQKECEYCHAPVIISTMSDIFSMSAQNISKYQKSYESDFQENPNNAELNTSLAFCYLKLGFYEKALGNLIKLLSKILTIGKHIYMQQFVY